MAPRPLPTNPTPQQAGERLLAASRPRTPKDWRKPNSYRRVPVSLFRSLANLGRRKYRAIVAAAWASAFWDGWKSGKKTTRIPTDEVMLTRRFMADHFGYNPNTIDSALADLKEHQHITVAVEAKFSGLKGKNLGRKYRLKWMENSKGEHCVRILWGLLVSDAFLRLSIETQAVLLLLHTVHYRRQNRLVIRPQTLAQYGIHRNRLPEHVDQLRLSGLLDHVDGYSYRFAWLNDNGEPICHKLKIVHSTWAGTAPNLGQDLKGQKTQC